MTIQEIEIYLKKHFFLVFRYDTKYYTIRRSQSLLNTQYYLIATDTLPHCQNSLEELCEQVYMSNGTLLAEAFKHIEIPEQNDPSWETYEAIRHSAIVNGNEIHFVYKQRHYWIAHTHEGLSHLSDDLGNTQYFNSCSDLFKDARIDGSRLEDMWKNVVVDAC